MASLLFAASYLTYNKIKAKRAEKKESKRQAYADRYSRLEAEQARDRTIAKYAAEKTADTEESFKPSRTTQSDEWRRRSSEESRTGETKTSQPSDTGWGGIEKSGEPQGLRQDKPEAGPQHQRGDPKRHTLI